MATSPIDFAGRRILVVEDEYTIATEIIGALEASGADVVGPVGTLERALALAKAELLDGAVLDIDLKGELVFPVADALAERGVRFVFATGYDRSIVPPQHHDVPRCEKPDNPAEIARVLFREITP